MRDAVEFGASVASGAGAVVDDADAGTGVDADADADVDVGDDADADADAVSDAVSGAVEDEPATDASDDVQDDGRGVLELPRMDEDDEVVLEAGATIEAVAAGVAAAVVVGAIGGVVVSERLHLSLLFPSNTYTSPVFGAATSTSSYPSPCATAASTEAFDCKT
eukprot:718044-Rhodomonas_salina.4